MYVHVYARPQVLERITKLNLSHNRLQSANCVRAFVGVATLQVSYNLLASRSDLDQLVELRKLTNLTLAGEEREIARGRERERERERERGERVFFIVYLFLEDFQFENVLSL